MRYLNHDLCGYDIIQFGRWTPTYSTAWHYILDDCNLNVKSHLVGGQSHSPPDKALV